MTRVEAKSENAATSLIAAVMLLSVGYAILRYHIAGPVPWKEFPFFILNKGICLGAFILLTLNFGLGPLNNLGVTVPPGCSTSTAPPGCSPGGTRPGPASPRMRGSSHKLLEFGDDIRRLFQKCL